MPTVNPAVTPTWVFTPNSSAPSNVTFYNNGRNTVYVGGPQVTQNSGVPVRPGGKPLELTGVTGTLYALSSVTNPVVAATMSSSAVTVGTTAITLATTVPTALAAGAVIIVGSTAGTGWEAQVVNTTNASSQITFANPLVQDHVGSSVIYTASAQYAQVTVVPGVL